MTFCPVWPSTGKLPDVPSVLFLGVDFPEESATYIEDQIASGLKILDLTDSPEVTYRCVRGIKEAAEVISTEKQEDIECLSYNVEIWRLMRILSVKSA